MRTEHLAQGCMEQVSSRVVPPYGRTPARVDFSHDRGADRDLTTVHAGTMRANARAHQLHVADARDEAEVVAQRADVRDLTSALYVERCLFQNDPPGVARRQLLHFNRRRAILQS